MVKLILIDAETNHDYELDLCPEDFDKANRDMNFDSDLLRNHIRSLEKPEAVPWPGGMNRDSETEEPSAESGCNQDTENFRWLDSQIRALIDKYKADEKVLRTGLLTAKKFWAKVALPLPGPAVTGPQCASKWAGLQKTYKRIVKHNEKSGNNNKDWVYLDLMEDVLGEKPFMKPKATLDTGIEDEGSLSNKNDDSQEESKDESKGNENTSKRRKTENVQKILKRLEENAAQRHKQHEENMAKQDRFLDLFEKLVNK